MKFKNMDVFKISLNKDGKIGIDITDKGRDYLKYYNISPDFFTPILGRLIMAMADKNQGEEYTNHFYNCFMAIFCCFGKNQGEYEFAFMDGPGTIDMLMQQEFGQQYVDLRMEYLEEIGGIFKDFEQDIKPMWDRLVDNSIIETVRKTQNLNKLNDIRMDFKRKNDQSGGEYKRVLDAIDEQIANVKKNK